MDQSAKANSTPENEKTPDEDSSSDKNTDSKQETTCYGFWQFTKKNALRFLAVALVFVIVNGLVVIELNKRSKSNVQINIPIDHIQSELAKKNANIQDPNISKLFPKSINLNFILNPHFRKTEANRDSLVDTTIFTEGKILHIKVSFDFQTQQNTKGVTESDIESLLSLGEDDEDGDD
mgnify:CR=1 FL=1